MYPAHPSALVGQAQQTAKVVTVDLKKRYVHSLDVIYSSVMGRKPKVPKFKETDNVS